MPARFFHVALQVLFIAVSIPAERLPVKIFTSADGLGSSFINSVMRDSRGFLWFSTRDGLSRFDGQQFVTYKIGGNEAPPGIESVYETKNGIYWIATTSGTYRFDPNSKKETVNISDAEKNVIDAKLITSNRGAFFEDANGRLWLGSDTLYLIEEAGGEISLRDMNLEFPDENWRKHAIVSFYETSDGSLWMTNRLGLIRRLPDQRVVFYKFTDIAGRINSSISDETGKIWITADDSIEVFKPELINEFTGGERNFIRHYQSQIQSAAITLPRLPEQNGEVVRFSLNKTVTDIYRHLYQSTDRHIWVTTGNSLFEFDGLNIRKYSAEQGLTAPLNRIIEDTDGNLWFSGQNGATRLNRFGMSAFSQADGLASTATHSIYSRGNELYAVNGGVFVSRFDGEKFESVKLAIDADSTFAWFSNVAFLDSRGEWWVLTEEKLYRFAASQNFLDLANQKPSAVYSQKDGLKGNLFFRIFEDSKANLWIVTRDREAEDIGLNIYLRNENRFRVFDENDNFPKNKAPASFAEDKNGNLWFGFYEDGLIVYRDGKFTEVSVQLPKGFFTALHFDSQNRLWLASSQSGVTRFDNPADLTSVSARWTTENGLSSNNVRSLVESVKGEIYVGTARGVDRISPETNRIRHFSASDGLSGDFVNVSAVDANGALWFGTPNGLSKFVPQNEKNETPPPVWISSLRVAGENRFVPPLGSALIDNLELSANQNNLQIDFFAVDFGDSEALRYQYKLEGADNEWSQPTTQRMVNYANLAAGKYHFNVRSINAAGLTGEPANISLNILAPFYLRSWFITASILLIGVGLFGFDRFRVKKTLEVKNALDISQKSEAAARISETRYRTLAETASDAIITIDETSRIIYVNEAAEKVFGYKPSELVGKPLTDLMPENLRGGHENGFGRYLKTNRKHLVWSAIELSGKHKSGATIPLELSFGEFESDGKRYFTGIARDVSERKRAEAALEKAREERLAELERVRSRIARDLHDDVGSSLTQIALFSEIAKQGGNDENKESLEFLVNTSNELVEAMSDIVWAINPQKDHFLDLTQRMRRFASELLSAADIDLEFASPDIGFDMPLGANLRREIFLIFKESINNIVKHSGAKSVEINFTLGSDFLNLMIKDNGNGFAAQEKTNGNYDWRATKGGNGLPGMRRRAADLGGDLLIESEMGTGTKIILRVPLEINAENNN